MAAPVNTVAPAITGTVEVGYTLTCSTGTWTGGADSFAFQWQRVNDSAVDISGATSSTYVVTSNDCTHTLQCVVTATNNTGSTEATSAATIVVPNDWFIPEDGTGLADANSYCSLAYAETYHAQRANTSWTLLTVGQKKASLVKATDYLQQTYRTKWRGVRSTAVQALDWPRSWVLRDDYEFSTMNGYVVIGGDFYYPSNVVPVEVKNAACEAALSTLTGSLLAEQGQGVIREKVDVLEVEYDKYSPQRRRFPVIDGLLRPFIMAGNMGVRV